MSSSSSIWHIANQEPDATRAQSLQDAYVTDSTRFLPDLQGGFRVYGHARKHVPPDPSYFFVDDALREHQYDVVHPQNKDWMIAYENDNYGQTRVLDLPSTRKMRTTMDGLPLGSIQPEDQIAMAADEARGPTGFMPWKSADPKSDEALIAQSRSDQASLGEVLGKNNEPGGKEGGVPSGGDGGPPTPPEGAEGGDQNLQEVKEPYNPQAEAEKKEREEFMMNYIGNLRRNKVEPSMLEPQNLQKFYNYFDIREHEQWTLNHELDKEDKVEQEESLRFELKSRALLGIYNTMLKSRMNSRVNKMVMQSWKGSTENVVDRVDSFYQYISKVPSAETTQFILQNMGDDLSAEEVLLYSKFPLDEKSIYGLHERLKAKLERRPLTPVSTPVQETLPGTDLPIPVLNPPSDAEKAAPVTQVTPPTLQALQSLPSDALVVKEYFNRNMKIEQFLTQSPDRSLTRIALDIQKLKAEDPKFAASVAAMYKVQTGGESYEKQLLKIQLPNLTENELNVLMEDPFIVETLRKTYRGILGKDPPPNESIVFSSMGFLSANLLSIPEQYRQSLFIPWDHFLNVITTPVNGGIKWAQDPRVFPYIKAARDPDYWKVTYIPALGQGKDSLGNNREYYDEVDHAIANKLGLGTVHGITSAELLFAAALTQMDISTKQGYETFREVLRKTIGNLDAIYQTQTQLRSYADRTPLVEIITMAYANKVLDGLRSNKFKTEAAKEIINDLLRIMNKIQETRGEYRQAFKDIRNRIADMSATRNASVMYPFYDYFYEESEDEKMMSEEEMQRRAEKGNPASSAFLNTLLTDISMYLGRFGANVYEETFYSEKRPLAISNAFVEAMTDFGMEDRRINSIPIVEYQTSPMFQHEEDPEAANYSNEVMKRVMEFMENKDDPKYYTGLRKLASVNYNRWKSTMDFIMNPENIRLAKIGYYGTAAIVKIWGGVQGVLKEAEAQRNLPETKKLAEEQRAESLNVTSSMERWQAGLDTSNAYNLFTSALSSGANVLMENAGNFVKSSLDLGITIPVRENYGAAVQVAAGAKGAFDYSWWFYNFTAMKAIEFAAANVMYANAIAASSPFLVAGGILAVVGNVGTYMIVSAAEKRGRKKNVSVAQSMAEYFIELSEIEAAQVQLAGKIAIKGATTLAKFAVQGSRLLLLNLLEDAKEDQTPEGLKRAARQRLINKIGQVTDAQLDALEVVFNKGWQAAALDTEGMEIPDSESSVMENTRLLQQMESMGREQLKLGSDFQILPTEEEQKRNIQYLAEQGVSTGIRMANVFKEISQSEASKEDSLYPIINQTLQTVLKAYGPLAQKEKAYAIGLYFQKNIRQLYTIAMILKALNPDPKFDYDISSAAAQIMENPAIIGQLLLTSTQRSIAPKVKSIAPKARSLLPSQSVVGSMVAKNTPPKKEEDVDEISYQA